MNLIKSKKVDVVLFDLGGTLLFFDTTWPEVRQKSDAILVQTLQEAGIGLEKDGFLTHVERRLNEHYSQDKHEYIEYTTSYIIRTLLEEWGYPNVPDQVLQRALQAMYSVSQAHWLPEEDASPTLKILLDLGYRLGMISNAGDDDDVQALVDKASLRSYFDIILTSAAQGIRKPCPRIFWQALSRWGAEPSRAVMVGDTLGADILGAKKAGIFSIWITRRADTPTNRDQGSTIHPDISITTLAELPALLAGL